MASWLASSASLLREQKVFASRDREVAQSEIARALNRHRMHWGRGGVDTALHLRKLDAVSVCLLRYGAEVDIEPEFPQSFYLLQIPVRGTARIHSDAGTLTVGEGRGAVISPTARVALQWERQSEQMLIKLPVSSVESVYRSVFDRPLAAPLEFDVEFLSGSGGAQAWLKLVTYALEQLQDLGGAEHTLAGRELARRLEDLLVMRFLLSQPHNHSIAMSRAARADVPRRIRLAEEFAMTHLGEAVTAADLARSAGISVRTLNKAFRDHCDTTPLAWLRERRLEAARAEMLAPASDTRVVDVALRWGFQHLGRFSALYRARYGESPRQTLGR